MNALPPSNRLRAALDLLAQVAHDARFLQLKNLTLNNGGVWGVPERPADFSPALFEVQLFGVSAFADDPALLPDNWMRAARNTLVATDTESAA